MNSSPLPKPPKVQSSLHDVLGSGMNEKLKLKEVMNQQLGYKKPRPPSRPRTV